MVHPSRIWRRLQNALAPVALLVAPGLIACGPSGSTEAEADASELVMQKDAGRDSAAEVSPDAVPGVLPDAVSAVLPDPVLFIHGVAPGPNDFGVMMQRLVADGWPADRLVAHLFADPRWGCNVENAATIAEWVDEVLAATGADKVDLVAHSMGSLSSRYFMRNLGGHDRVRTYVTLGGMHHGLFTSCLAPEGQQCTWDELCQTRDFIAALNQDPVTPGPAAWVSFSGEADSTVPSSSSYLDGAENESFPGVEHSGANGLLEVEAVYVEVRRVLAYDVP